jgi:ribosomal protein L11 methyltransferase
VAWQRVSLVVPGEHVSALVQALEEGGAISTDLSDADAGTSDEHAWFAEPGADEALWPRCRLSALVPDNVDVNALLAAASISAASLDRVEEQDWVRITQAQFAPIRAGERLWIVPTWHELPDPHAVNVILDPGAAFGTGSHPTTRLVLAWLERHVRAGDTVLDYGCGSGILGIAALKLGAARATGVDVDPLALEAARYNASRNAVELDARDAHAGLAISADVTVANILANPLRMLAPLLAAHTRAGGWIALSGILEEQAGEVARAYSQWAALERAGTDSGWVLLAGRRR